MSDPIDPTTKQLPSNTIKPFADYWDQGGSPYMTNSSLGQATGNEIQSGDCNCTGTQDQFCEVDTTVYKMKIPIGLRSQSQKVEDKSLLQSGCQREDVRNYLQYRYPSGPFNLDQYTFNNELVGGYPARLTDEVASLCAGGEKLEEGEYLRTDSKRMNEVDWVGGWAERGASNECSLFLNDADKENDCTRDCNDIYYTVETDWPTFCQLGDYIQSESECRDQCVNVIAPTASSVNGNYCHFAKDRICSKQRVPYHDQSETSKKYVHILKRGDGTEQRNRSIILGYKDRVLAFYS